MGKLQLNDDGTITFMVGAAPDARAITLPEPTFGQMNRIMERALAADADLPQLTALDRDDNGEVTDQAQVDAFTTSLRERTKVMFSGESPHAAVLCDIVKELTGDNVEQSDLPSWAGSPRALNAILSQWQAPLPGPASDLLAAT